MVTNRVSTVDCTIVWSTRWLCGSYSAFSLIVLTNAFLSRVFVRLSSWCVAHRLKLIHARAPLSTSSSVTPNKKKYKHQSFLILLIPPLNSSFLKPFWEASLYITMSAKITLFDFASNDKLGNSAWNPNVFKARCVYLSDAPLLPLFDLYLTLIWSCIIPPSPALCHPFLLSLAADPALIPSLHRLVLAYKRLPYTTTFIEWPDIQKNSRTSQCHSSYQGRWVTLMDPSRNPVRVSGRKESHYRQLGNCQVPWWKVPWDTQGDGTGSRRDKSSTFEP